MNISMQFLVALGFVTALSSGAGKVFAANFWPQASVWGTVVPKAAIARELSSDGARLLTLRREETPSLLRLRILPKANDPWEIEIHLPQPELAEPLLINNGNWRDFMVYEDVIEVFAPSGGDVFARTVKGSVAISYEEVVVLSDAYRFQPRYKVGELNLAYIPQDIDPSDPLGQTTIANGRAVMLLSYDYKGHKGRCTASQVAPGYFLTNLHCVTDETGAPRLEAGITLFFGDGDFSKPELPSFPAKRRAILLTTYGEGGKPYEKWPLDYALLSAEIPAGLEAALLPLDQGRAPGLGTHLGLYQIWQGAGARAGKAISRDSQCKVVTRSAVQGGCSAEDISHQCDSEAGSSGSPLVVEGGNVTSGLHYWGHAENVGNCAIPALRILDDIKRKAPDIWKLLTKAGKEKSAK